jgi:branched-chain amino acid aminotransferase
MIVYLNGSYLADTEAKVSAFDGGFLFGDGLFESFRLYGGKPFDLDGHLARLNRELDLLGFTWRATGDQISAILQELVERNDLTEVDARARLVVSRGVLSSERPTLQELQTIEPTMLISLASLPAALSTWQSEGIRATVMKPAFARGNFPQLKTLNYLSSQMAMRFAATSECQEAILVDRQGLVLEGATSNVFLVQEGRLLTPPVRLGILAGRTRAVVMTAARELGYGCEEAASNRRDLATADEVFLTSSVREILPVIKIDNSRVSDGRPGSITRALQSKYRQVVNDALAAEAG